MKTSRKSQIVWAALFVIVSAFLAAPVWAAGDCRVKGFWLEIPGLPEEDATSSDVQPGGGGEAFFEWSMDGGALVLSTERIRAKDSDGGVLGPGDAGKLSVRLQALRHKIEVDEADINAAELVEKPRKIHSYPVAAARYETGEALDTRINTDVFFFTEEWVFRVHIALTTDYMEDPDIADKIEGWFANMEIVERGAAAKPGETVRQRLPERVVPEIIPPLYRLCKL